MEENIKKDNLGVSLVFGSCAVAAGLLIGTITIGVFMGEIVTLTDTFRWYVAEALMICLIAWLVGVGLIIYSTYKKEKA